MLHHTKLAFCLHAGLTMNHSYFRFLQSTYTKPYRVGARIHLNVRSSHPDRLMQILWKENFHCLCLASAKTYRLQFPCSHSADVQNIGVNCWTLKYSKPSVRYHQAHNTGRGDPIPFLESKARKFKVDDAYRVHPKTAHKQRYAMPLGLTLFSVIIYLGFVRKYDEADSSKIAFLTQDISSKLPEGARESLFKERNTEDDTDNKHSGR